MGAGRKITLVALGILVSGCLAFLGLGALRSSSLMAGTDGRLEISESDIARGAEQAFAELGISVEPYRHGVISFDDVTIRTERNGEDGFGIFFRPRGVSNSSIIRFSATGDGRIVIRTTVSSKHHYHNASVEDFLKFTPQTDEVLIFTEEASHIDIKVHSIGDCAMTWDTFCADETYLAEKIGVSRTADPGEEELLQILDWAANNLVWSGNRAFTAEANELVKKYSAAQMYASVYEPESGGGFCGASGVFLSKVLNDFGYQSITINFGTGPSLTHVSTLVYSPFGDGKFYMVDPTFNSIFIDEITGEWIAFDDLLAGYTKNVTILERPVEQRKFLVIDPSVGLTNCRQANGRADAKICSRPGYNFDVYMSSFQKEFVKAGLSPDKTGYMHMLRSTYFNVGNQAGGDVRERFIDLLKQNNIEFGG